MKSLGSKLLLLFFLVLVTNTYAIDTPSKDFSQMSYTEITKSSIKLATGCKKKTKIKRDQVKSIIESYINEVDYRCSKANPRSEEGTTCKLTLFRLKSDLLKCDSDDYYYNKLDKYISF